MATRPSAQFWERGHARIHVPTEAKAKAGTGPIALRKVTLLLPMPPSVNEAWNMVAYVHKGKPAIRKVLTDEHRTFRREVEAIAIHEMKAQVPMTGRIELEVLLYYIDKRATDIDNRLKPLLDALTHAGVWMDDRLVDRIMVERIRVQQLQHEWCHCTLTEISR